MCHYVIPELGRKLEQLDEVEEEEVLLTKVDKKDRRSFSKELQEAKEKIRKLL